MLPLPQASESTGGARDGTADLSAAPAAPRANRQLSESSTDVLKRLAEELLILTGQAQEAEARAEEAEGRYAALRAAVAAGSGGTALQQLLVQERQRADAVELQGQAAQAAAAGLQQQLAEAQRLAVEQQGQLAKAEAESLSLPACSSGWQVCRGSWSSRRSSRRRSRGSNSNSSSSQRKGCPCD